MTQMQRPRIDIYREGVVYGIDVLDHDAWMRGEMVLMPNDYIGQTRQQGRSRENQHRDDKPWSDLIVGSPRKLWERVCFNKDLDDAELALIQGGVDGVRPRLNWKGNEDNPLHIPLPRQVEQRWARDDRRGEPRWVPLEQRRASGLLDAPCRPWPAQPVRRVRPAWQIKLAWWFTSWLVLAVTFSGLCIRHTEWPMDVDLSVGGCAAAIMLLWGLWRKPDTRAMWRRRLRRWFR